YFAPAGAALQSDLSTRPLPPRGWGARIRAAPVEAPGTAPGSDGFIAAAIYRHSRLAPAVRNISVKGCRKKTEPDLIPGFRPVPGFSPGPGLGRPGRRGYVIA